MSRADPYKLETDVIWLEVGKTGMSRKQCVFNE